MDQAFDSRYAPPRSYLQVEEQPNDALTDGFADRVRAGDYTCGIVGLLAASNMRAYAILDGGRIWGLPELLEASGHPYRCLFPESEEFGNVAPWLVELTPDSALLLRLLTAGDKPSALWRCQAAIFLRSHDDIDALQAHLCRLTKVSSDAGPALFFRFWDPAVAHHYFQGIADWSERISSFFWSAQARIEELIAPSEIGGSTRRFILHADAAAPRTDFLLQSQDRSLLADAHWPRFQADLADWLPRADPYRFRGFASDRRMKIARHAIHEGRIFGFRYKEEYSYFLYMMFFLGGWFHKSPVFADMTRHLTAEDDNRYARIRHAFPKDYEQKFSSFGDPMELLATFRDHLKSLLAERDGWDGLRDDDALSVLALAERPFLHDPASLAANRRLAMAEAERLRIRSQRDAATFYAFWLVLGAWFHRDPLFPWAAEKLKSPAGPEQGIMDMAAYALRRMDRSLNLHRRIADA